jgi:tetratricopeptide (TPR) repeat protein
VAGTGAAEGIDGVVAELRERLRRHPADQRPLQHATAQFHLGGVLLGSGALDEAETAFARAAALFAARGARPEQAKALNGLGATLRTAGRPGLAARAFAHAAQGFVIAALPLEEGAARCNLGSALREDGRAEEAAGELERAVELLDPAQVPAQAAVAAHEHGLTLLALEDLGAAETVLAAAVALAERARDETSRGAAANALGLVRLSSGRPAAAAAAFATAVAASPRAVRPEAFAMAKANLALAGERTGAHPQARLAARQALAAPAVPAPVRAQATGVLARLGTHRSDLRTALEQEHGEEARARLVREELLRAAGPDERGGTGDAAAWLEAITASQLEPVAVAEWWLAGLLELPPDALERLARAAIATSMDLDDEARETFRTAVTRGMVRFHVPQMMRLEEVFATAATAAGDPSPWR